MKTRLKSALVYVLMLAMLCAAAAIPIGLNASASGSQPGVTSPPPATDFTPLPSTETRRGLYQPFIKPTGDKGIVVTIPPRPAVTLQPRTGEIRGGQ